MDFLWSISYLGSPSTADSAVVDVKTGLYYKDVYDPSDATVSISFSATGLLTVSGSGSAPYSWLVPTGTEANYSIRYTPITGALTIGNENVWENLGTVRTFGLTRTSLGEVEASGTFEIRRDSDGVVLDSADVIFNAEVHEAEGGGGGGAPPGGGVPPGEVP